MERVYHALVLNLHQPSGNLDYLWEHDNWAAKEVLFALDRMPRSLWDYEPEGAVHLSLSGTLLETLADPNFQAKVFGSVNCGQLLWHLQNTAIFRILGTGYYHPVLPLIPEADRADHLERWQGLAQHLFWRREFQGFWPPEMGFCEELIPLLVGHGYRYVLVDNEYVEPLQPFDWASQRYRPYVASYGGSEIVVIPRDRELSNAQLSGMDPGWF
ncbi:MAG: glycoside hydrolase family 57, partial [Opitutales bacterium]